jgi:lambda repressor-like predicted transcriptional regulator
MTPVEIKMALEQRETSLAIVSRQLGVSGTSVTNVVKRHMTSARIERAIAKTLDKPIHVVFPDRYSAPADYKELEMVSISRDELTEIRATLAKATKIIDCLQAG